MPFVSGMPSAFVVSLLAVIQHIITVAPRAQASQAQSTAPKREVVEGRSADDVAAGSQDATVADAISCKTGKSRNKTSTTRAGVKSMRLN